MPRPIQAEISVSALAHNLRVAQRARAGSKIWAVVKAAAYGHANPHVNMTSAQAWRHLLPGLSAADGLALLDLEEAVLLRQAGWSKPILLLEGVFNAADWRVVDDYQLSCVIHHPAQIDALEAVSLVSKPVIYLKMNTGMNRLGLVPTEYLAAYERLMRLRQTLRIAQICHMTHFANADAPLEQDAQPVLSMPQQLNCFQQALEELPGDHCVANSAAILQPMPLRSDWIRPGIMLYGSSPFAHLSAQQLGLKPVMTLHSEVIGIQTLKAGDSVGYGSRYIATQPMRIAIVACGYADGYPRHAPGESTTSQAAPILVAGQRTQIVGRVSMDMLAADVTHIPQAVLGSSVTLWGQGLSVDEVAQAAGTIGYELLCALNSRVPVVYTH